MIVLEHSRPAPYEDGDGHEWQTEAPYDDWVSHRPSIIVDVASDVKVCGPFGMALTSSDCVLFDDE